MKKMKRALSLLLTAVMLLGMFVVPTGAASTTSFTDAELIENTEAVQITSGIGLFAGTTDGRFAPKATVTRAQMATIIVKMLRGNEFNADAFKGVGVNPFPDTASFEGGWAEGYINACSQMGVVAGYGDGTFKPGRELTTAEAITMIINALGIDPGPGDWPVNYMAKAEAMKLYGDLAVKPATDDPLNRDQLAVIVWEGLKYSPKNQSGWRIANYDMVFENYVDALKANGGSPSGISEAVGEDTLASKVYEIKTAAGWITENQATGEKFTILTRADGSEEKYGVETSVNMLGHYVTVYYKEKYTSDKQPGQVYTIVDESTVVTVKETINSTKDYKAAFLGQNVNVAENGFVFNSNYVGTHHDGKNAAGNPDNSDKLSAILAKRPYDYKAGSKAAEGTYIIVDSAIVAYIEPVTVFASYIVDIGTVEDDENIWVSNANGDVGIPNTEGHDQVVEYAGMKIGDYVTYRMVQGMYVLEPVTAVTGVVTKTHKTEYYGSKYDTIALDGTDYMTFGGTNQLGNKLETDLTQVEPGQMYKLYITGDNRYIGFEKVSGGVSMDTTAFMLGSIIVKEKDQYAKSIFVNKARGIDMSGSEIMLPIGKAKDSNGNGVFDPADETVGNMNQVLQGFNNYVESTEKEAKKEGIYELTAFGAVYSPETPTYALKPITTSTIFTGTNTVATAEGIAALGTAGMKFFVLGGSLTDNEPLSVSKGIPSAFYPTKEQAVNSYMLVTRQPHGALSNINIWIYLSDDKVGEEVPFYVTDEQIKKPGATTDGKTYTVWSAATGEEIELVMDPAYGVTLTQPGMFVARQDEYGLVFAVEKVAESTSPTFNDEKAQIVTNIGFWGLTTNRLRGERLASTSGGSGVAIDMINNWNNNASSAKVIDLRTEEEIKASGVGKITSLKQMVTMRENDPGLIVIYDLYMEDSSNGTSGTVKTVFITKAHRRTVGMNSVVYAFEEPVSGDEMMVVRSLSATMGDRVRVNFEACRNGGPGFYRYCVDADGKLSLIPYDDKALSTGNYGMFAMHDEVVDVEVIDSATMQVTTANAVTPDCGYNCAHAGEPRKEFVITAATTTILDTDGTRIPFETFDDLFQNNSLIINYYCDTPVNNSSYADDMDTSAELIVISSRTEVFVSCDGSCQNGTPVDSASDITGAGKYYLTADLSENITVSSGNVELCLNGHSINGTATVSGGQLTLTNCASRSGGNVTGGLKVNGGKAVLDDAVFATGVTVASGATFEMMGGKVTGAETSGVTNNGTFIMRDGTITGNTATNGGGVLTSGTFTMTGGTITSNTATSGGGVYVQNGGHLVLSSNAAIVGNTAKTDGGGVRVAGGGTVTMDGGSINSNTANTRGGGVILEGTSTMQAVMTMNGGQINGNVTSHYGGGVSLRAYNKFTMNDGTIAGNKFNTTNKFGTQISIGNNVGATTSLGNFVMNDGTIDNGDAGGYAVPVLLGTATIKGGTIIGELGTVGALGGKADLIIEGGTFSGDVTKSVLPLPSGTNRGAETLTIKGGTFNEAVTNAEISGGTFNEAVTNAEISGGTLNGDVSDATISGVCELNGTVNNSAFTGGTYSGSWTVGTNVNIAGGTTFVGKTKADLANANIADGYDVVEDSSGVSVQYAYEAFDAAAQHGAHGLAVAAGDTLYGGANYYLDSDLTGGIAVEGSGELTLCLNGHTISTNDANAITVSGNVTLQLCNCSAVSGNVKGGGTGSGMRINGGTVNMYKNVHFDDGVYGDANPIRVVGSTSTFVMHDGVISGNTTAVSGGGVHVISGSTFAMNNGTISNNVSGATAAQTGGGGVFVSQSTFDMYDGKIVCNEAKTQANPGGGGGVHSVNSTFTMHGGVIAGNKCGHDGGGVWFNGGTFEMKGGTIGGDTKATASNLSEFTGNYSNNVTTYNGGGGVAIAGGTFKMSGGEIKGNISAKTVNDGLWLAGNTNLTITDGSVINNAESGGNDFRPSSTNASNTATVSGGEFGKMTVVNGSKLKITGGTFGSDPGAYVASTHQAVKNGAVWIVSAK